MQGGFQNLVIQVILGKLVTKYNKDGVVDTSWGTNGSKTGKTLSVSSADVDTKATFMVVVAI